MLIGARTVQGLGGAVASAVSLSLMMTLFTQPAERAKAMGIFGFVAAAEHMAAHHDGADGRDRFDQELVVGAGLAAREAVRLPPALEPNGPLVQLVPTPAQRLLERRIRPGDETVDRDRNLGQDLAHDSYEISVAAVAP